MRIDNEKARKLDRLHRTKPMLSFACVDLTALLEDIRARSFPGVAETPSWQFVQSGTLACIVRHDQPTDETSIYINPLLSG